MDRYVRLQPVTDDGETGYEAILVEAWDDPDLCIEPIEDVLAVWDLGIIDAGLVARTRAIEWARVQGVRYQD